VVLAADHQNTTKLSNSNPPKFSYSIRNKQLIVKKKKQSAHQNYNEIIIRITRIKKNHHKIPNKLLSFIEQSKTERKHHTIPQVLGSDESAETHHHAKA